MESSILYFFLLVLGIPLYLGLDSGYKQGKFSKTLLEKDLKFISSREDSTVAFDLGLMLLPAEINLVAEEHSCKEYMLSTSGISRVKVIFVLLIKVIALYMNTSVIQVGILGIEGFISGCKVYLAIFLALDKQF